MPLRPAEPPLLLLLSLDVRALPWAVLHEGGTSTAGHGVASIPGGTLCLHWPSRFPWTAELLETAARVRDEGGVVLPLSAVLRKLGRSSPRNAAGLFAAFDLETEGMEPGDAVRRLAPALARALAETDAPAPGPDPRSALRPEIRFALADLPHGPGVYVFSSGDGRVLYVGKARSLARRVARHLGPRPAEAEKSAALVRDAARLRWTETGSDLEALLREQIDIERERPALNTQERVHARPRGAWRRARVLCVLPSAQPRSVEVCFVTGDGAFHWERAERGAHLPRGLWPRLRAVMGGEATGWAPGGAEALSPEAARALAEITLGWLARHGDAVTRIDLRHETEGKALRERLRRLLGTDPRTERVEMR